MTTPNGASNAGWETSFLKTPACQKIREHAQSQCKRPTADSRRRRPTAAAAPPHRSPDAPTDRAGTELRTGSCSTRAQVQEKILIHPLGQPNPQIAKISRTRSNVNRQPGCGECERSKNSGGNRRVCLDRDSQPSYIPKRQKTNQACHQSHHMVRNPDQRVCPRRNLHRVPPFHVSVILWARKNS